MIYAIIILAVISLTICYAALVVAGRDDERNSNQ